MRGKTHRKLHALRVVKDEQSTFQYLSYGHSIDKLKSTVICSHWKMGSTDITNCPEMRASSDEGYPLYQIIEVPYVI